MKNELEIEISEKLISFTIFLIASMIIFIYNYNVAVNFPIVFGDEGFHMKIARDLARIKEIPEYQISYGDNISKQGYIFTQYFHLLESFLFLFNEYSAKVILPITVFINALAIFIFASIFFNYKVALISSILFQMFPSVVIYSVTFYADMTFVFFTFLSFLFIFLYFRKKELKYLITSSIMMFLLLISKPFAPYVIAASIFFIFVLEFFKSKEKILLKHFFIFIIVFLVFFSSLIIRNLILYNSICIGTGFESVDNLIFSLFKNQKCLISLIEYKPKYEFGGRTEKVGSEQDVLAFGLENFLNFTYGYPLLTLFFIFSLTLQTLNKKYEYLLLFLPFFILITIQMLQRNVLITGILYRAEDTARYILQYSPFVSILISFGIVSLIENFAKMFKKNYATIFYSLFIFSFILIVFYMQKAYSEKLDIMKNLKQYSSYFFEACDWVKNNLPNNTTLHSLWAYRVGYNCDRRVGGPGELRLSKDLNYTIQLAKLAGVDYFFIEKFSLDPLNRRLGERYDSDWVEWLLAHPNNFVKVYENGIPIDTCIQYLRVGYPCDGVIIFYINKTA